LIVIPAIDIKGGRCVRLKQGRMSEETIYSDFPEEMARKWFRLGAERIHLVDLDGAVNGAPINKSTIEKIVNSVPVSFQLGGGIRDMESIEAYLNLGIHQVILGTVVVKDPDFAGLACNKFPGRIILGIDARNDKVAVEGWTEETALSPIEIAKQFENSGIAAIIYTDIHRAGMSSGPNIESTKSFARSVNVPVIASGGISDIKDVKSVLGLQKYGVTGMITGRAIYQGTLNLHDAISIAKREKKRLEA